MMVQENDVITVGQRGITYRILPFDWLRRESGKHAPYQFHASFTIDREEGWHKRTFGSGVFIWENGRLHKVRE